MPDPAAVEAFLLRITTSKSAQIDAMEGVGGRVPFPRSALIAQAAVDRISLAGTHFRTADTLLLQEDFRSAISRFYYAMYHAARAITFAHHGGDDHERHSVLPRNLPSDLERRNELSAELVGARLLRNQADYDPYPSVSGAWRGEAQSLASTAAGFVQSCEAYALEKGYV